MEYLRVVDGIHVYCLLFQRVKYVIDEYTKALQQSNHGDRYVLHIHMQLLSCLLSSKLSTNERPYRH